MTRSALITRFLATCVTLLERRPFLALTTRPTMLLSFFGGNQSRWKKVVKGENSEKKHAETEALSKIKMNSRKKYDLLVVRLTRSGKLSSSRPCFHCLCKLEKSGVKIRHVYYSTQDGTIAREKFTEMKDSPLTYISSGHRNYS